jgi:hypothetical protein
METSASFEARSAPSPYSTIEAKLSTDRGETLPVEFREFHSRLPLHFARPTIAGDPQYSGERILLPGLDMHP